MTSTMRTLGVLAGLTVLATASQAQITLSNPVGPAGSVVFTQTNEALFTPANLSQGLPGTDTGSFDVTTVNGLASLQVGEVTGAGLDGNVSLTVWLNSTVIYSDTTTIDNPLMTSSIYTLPTPLFGTNTVSYEATLTPNGPAPFGYLGGFTVDAYEPVPEPSSYAAVGLGLVGLVARRRRSKK